MIFSLPFFICFLFHSSRDLDVSFSKRVHQFWLYGCHQKYAFYSVMRFVNHCHKKCECFISALRKVTHCLPFKWANAVCCQLSNWVGFSGTKSRSISIFCFSHSYRNMLVCLLALRQWASIFMLNSLAPEINLKVIVYKVSNEKPLPSFKRHFALFFTRKANARMALARSQFKNRFVAVHYPKTSTKRRAKLVVSN